MPTLIDHCPSCTGSLRIRELHCPACDITIRGDFDPPVASGLQQLTEEQEAFLRLFVLSRGNMSDVERNLGVSYPTVRAKLDDLIAALSGSAAPAPPSTPAAPSTPTTPDAPAAAVSAPSAPASAPAPAPASTPAPSSAGSEEQGLSRTEILERIANGRLTPDEGMRLLRGLGDR